MRRQLALCSVVSLAFCGASLAQSGERESARPQYGEPGSYSPKAPAKPAD